jgi:hypothetical protein
MRFGIYVHTAGSTWFDQTANALHRVASEQLKEVVLDDFDGLYISFEVASSCPDGFRVLKRRVRRDYELKLITGGAHFFKCMVELDVELGDPEVLVKAGTEASLFEFTQSAVIRCLPLALKGFEARGLRAVEAAVANAKMPHASRW